jgi:hypothetical protein
LVLSVSKNKKLNNFVESTDGLARHSEFANRRGGGLGTQSYELIPKKIASDYGLSDEDHVTVETTKEGILIKRLQI